MKRSKPVTIMLAGPIPNDSYIKTLVAQYDRELFGEGGYRKFVADSACEIDLTDLWDTEAPSSPDKTASSPDKAHGRCKRHRGLVLASRGQPPSGSGSKAYKFASPYPTVSPNAAAVRSALLYRRSEEGDMNESVTTNDSIPACEPRDPPVARLPASPPSTDVSSTDLVSPTPPPKSVLRTGVLPSLPSSPIINRCYVELLQTPRTTRTARTARTTVPSPKSEPTKLGGATRTKTGNKRQSL